MFSGLSAFLLTPMNEAGIDEQAFIRLIHRLAEAGVDSIGALGSTGCYPYLTLSERVRIVSLAVQHAKGIPVIVGIGSLRTKEVLKLADEAQKAGAGAVLLAPISYHQLTEREVFTLYETVNRSLSIPLCVYDNPSTTHFHFTDEFYGCLSELSQVKSIKIPGIAGDIAQVRERILKLRTLISDDVSIGISGDACAVTGLAAGCDLWYSVIGGLFPKTALKLTRLIQSGQSAQALELSKNLEGLWELFKRHNSSLRVIATVAEIKKWVETPCLPLPLQTLENEDRKNLALLIEKLELE